MKKPVDPTEVATQIKDRVPEFLRQYFDEPASYTIEILKGGAINTNFVISDKNSCEKYVLTVFNQMPFAQVMIQTHLLDFFTRHGFKSSRVLRTLQTNASAILFDQRPTILKSYIPGTVHKVLNAQQLVSLAQNLAALHQLPSHELSTLLTDNSGLFAHLRESHFDIILKSIPELAIHEPFLTWFRSMTALLASHKALVHDRLGRGLIHSDLFVDNVIYDGNQVRAIIDFEGATIHHLALDIAMTLVGAVWSAQAFAPDENLARFKLFLESYSLNAPLTAQEKRAVYYYMIQGSLALAGWRYRQYQVFYPASEFKKPFTELSSLTHALVEQGEFKSLFCM